jgi:hypothetical protein
MRINSNSLRIEDSLQLAAGSFNAMQADQKWSGQDLRLMDKAGSPEKRKP